jgi:hypothetical protein
MASNQYSQLSTMTGSRQTMMSWAKVVDSWEDVPGVYRESYRMVAPESSSTPYTVFAPAMLGLSLTNKTYTTTEKLLCEVGDTIYVWERIGKQVAMVAYPLKTISDLEVGEILLYSWITIGGVTHDGMACSTTIEFNQSTASHFAPFVDKMRPAPQDMDEREERAERAKLNYVGLISRKFWNYGIESLVGGDEILQTLWQPKICKPIVTVGGRVFYQTTLSLEHLAILTHRELIIIENDERSRENRGVRYGGKRLFIALSHISGVSLPDAAGDPLRLCLTLSPGGRQIEIICAASNKQKIARLKDELEKLIGQDAD